MAGCSAGAAEDAGTVLAGPADDADAPSASGTTGGQGDAADPPPPDNMELESFAPVEGGRVLRDHPVEFSREAEGGVSMVVSYLRGISTNNVWALGTAVDIYRDHDQEIDPETAGAEFLAERARDIADQARESGREFDPRTFPDPASSYDITPVGVMWRAPDSSTVEVFVLAEETIADGRGLVHQRTNVHAHAIEWDPVARVRFGDWLITEDLDPSWEDYGIPDDQSHSPDHPFWTPLVEPQPRVAP